MKEKILFVDDDFNSRITFRRQINKKFELDAAGSGNEGLELLNRNGPYTVVIADMYMPEMNGIQFLEKVREIYPDTIRIMLTGHADMNLAIDAVNKGRIFHFLTKPCQSRTMLKILEIGAKEYKKNVKNRMESYTDELTGLWNRRYFNNILITIMNNSERYSQTFSLLFFDINDFKKINDKFGHNTGDAALKITAETLKEKMRDIDILARYGGDEFVIIAQYTKRKGAHTLVNRIKNHLKTKKIKDYDSINICISAGIATYPVDSKQQDELINIADKAMYEDKRRNKS